jgi:hypothetical protein
MFSLDLTPAEVAVLREVLESDISDLGMEIAGTDSLDFREGLKARRSVLQKVLAALPLAPGAGGATLIAQQSVSRKTPLDGRLEISPTAAERLAAIGAELRVRSAGNEASARLHALPCTCGEGAEGSHLHHFLESPVLRDLVPGSEVRLELDQAATLVQVEPA